MGRRKFGTVYHGTGAGIRNEDYRNLPPYHFVEPQIIKVTAVGELKMTVGCVETNSKQALNQAGMEITGWDAGRHTRLLFPWVQRPVT